jgi:hypothetical protein
MHRSIGRSLMLIDRRAASFAAVIGEDFSGGRLQKFADHYQIALITTDMLCELLRMHDQLPFNLLELRELFVFAGRADQSMQVLRERHANRRRNWQLIVEMVELIESFERKMPHGFTVTVDRLHTSYLTAEMVKREQSPLDIPTEQDVADAMAFLASRAVNVLVEVPGSGGAYQLAMNSATTRKLLHALAQFVSSFTTTSRTSAPTWIDSSIEG